jgi:serine/threonine protein kinase
MPRLNNRVTAIKDRLAEKDRRISELLSKLIAECLDPDPDKRPTSLDLLSVSFKAQASSDEAIQRSTSFWRTMANHPDRGVGGLVAKTTQNFISGYLGYLNLLHATFSPAEVCLLMSLQALGHSPSMLTSAGRLMKSQAGEDQAATVLHAAASATSKDKFLKKLSWDISKWPHNPSLCHLSLRENENGLLPSTLAAWEGDREVLKQLLDIEYSTQSLCSSRRYSSFSDKKREKKSPSDSSRKRSRTAVTRLPLKLKKNLSFCTTC